MIVSDMLRCHRTYLIVFVLFLTGGSENISYCQSSDAPAFNRLNISDGLVSQGITDLELDTDGFLWVGTTSGLSRYDGSTFTSFHYSDDPCGLADGHIVRLAVSPDSNLVITTKSGWSIYDRESQCITNFSALDSSGARPVYYRYAMPDTGGVMWLAGATGIARFNPNNQSTEYYSLPQRVLDILGSRSEVRDILQDPLFADQLFISLNDGLCTFNKVSGEFDCDLHRSSGLARPFYNGGRLFTFDQHKIWYATWGNGMVIFDRRDSSWQNYITAQGKLFVDASGRNIPWDVATSMERAANGTMWIGFRRGLGILDTATNQLELFTHDKSNPQSLSSVVVTDVLKVPSGEIYVSTDNGLNVFEGSSSSLQQIDPIQDLPTQQKLWEGLNANEDKLYFCARVAHGNTLIYSDAIFGGLVFYNTAEHKFEHLSITAPGEAQTTFYDAVLMPNGKVALGSSNSVYLLDPESRQLSQFPNDALYDTLREARLFRPRIVSLRDDEIILWDRRKLISTKRSDIYTLSVEDYLPGYQFDAVVACRDHGQLVWINTTPFLLDGNTLRPLSIDNPPTARVNDAIFVDSLLWISTAGAGVFGYSIDAERLHLAAGFDSQSGLSSNDVAALSADRSGNIWGSTTAGMFRLEIASGLLRNFSIEDGLQASFIDEPAAVFEDGSIIFDDRRFLYRWNGESNAEFNGTPYIQYIDFGDSVHTRIDHTLKLPPSQNSVFIKMGVVDHTNGTRDRVEYLLSGFDTTWQQAGTDRIARYTNLSPGAYTFNVRAINPDGKISNVVSAKFDVLAALHEQPWFYPAILLLFGVFFYVLYTRRLRTARKRQATRLKHEREVAELELKALRSQMNPHFMFNSLNSIKNFILKAEPSKASEYLSSFAHLIRLTLQNSRERTITLSQELEALLLYIDLERMRLRGGFEFNCSVDDSIDMNVVEIPPMILQPYVENAIWHGLLHKEGARSLSISFRRENGWLSCAIDDNGIGREQANTIKSKSARKYKSMGMGITQDRVDILNRLDSLGIELCVEDKINEDGSPSGTQVKIKIPYASNTN